MDDLENENNTMASVDSESLKSEKSSVIDAEELNPIEVKSTAHLDRIKEQQKKDKAAAATVSVANEIFDWFDSILIAVTAIILIFTLLIRVNTVSGPSMNPTLVDGERLLVSGLAYTPDYNDIVIIQANKLVNDNGEYGKPIVKRIIGLPGDEIRIDFSAGIVYRNGEALDIEVIDNVIYEDGHRISALTTLAEDMTEAVTIPEECYFVLGDNRINSKDSRDSSIYFINKNYIVGKAIYRIFPFDSFGSIY